MATETSNQDLHIPKVNAVAKTYIDDLLKEKANLSDDFPLISVVVDDAIDRIYACGRIPGKSLPADVFKQKPIKLSQCVFLPIKQYPNFNFKGKILGPKGNTLKRLHQETMCNIAIRGRTSMRDGEREEELRQSGDMAFNHLNKNLHIEISTVAPPAEAYARIAFALSEIRKYIIPDKNDEISQEQYRELLEMHPEYAKRPQDRKSVFSKMRKEKTDFEETVSDEEDSPPAPKKAKLQNGVAKKAAAPTPTVMDKIKDIRVKPIQKKSPVKK